MSYKRYSEYKDSGIEWIGEIPKEWKTLRNKYNFILNKNIVGKESSVLQLLSLTKYGVKAIKESEQSGKVPLSFDTYQKVKKNDLIMCLFDLDVSAVFSGLSNFDGMISSAYKCLRCCGHIVPKYADYYFMTVFVDRKYKRYSKNVRYSLSLEEFMALSILVPSLNEQQSIVSYLDMQCTLIDKAIETQNKIIEKLKEYKKSIITEAVTKGLDKNAKMKDSGIEWIGKIPEGWEVVKGKYIFKMFGGSIKEENLSNKKFDNSKKIIYFKVDDMNLTELGFEMVYDDKDLYTLKEYKEISAPLILIPKRGAAIYTNKVRISNRDCLVDPNIMAIRVIGNIKFYAYFLYGRTLVDIGDVSTIPQINNKHLESLIGKCQIFSVKVKSIR